MNLSPSPWRYKGKHPGDIADARGCPVLSVWMGGLSARHFKANSAAALRLPGLLAVLTQGVIEGKCSCPDQVWQDGQQVAAAPATCFHCRARGVLAEIEGVR